MCCNVLLCWFPWAAVVYPNTSTVESHILYCFCTCEDWIQAWFMWSCHTLENLIKFLNIHTQPYYYYCCFTLYIFFYLLHYRQFSPRVDLEQVNRNGVEKITKLLLWFWIALICGRGECATSTITVAEWHTQCNPRLPCSWGSWSPSPWCVPGTPQAHSSHSRWGEGWTGRSTWDEVKSKIKLHIQFPIPKFILFMDFQPWLIVTILSAN